MKNKMIFLLCTTIIFLAVSFTSDNSLDITTNPEKKGIEKTIEMYFEGWLKGDTTMIGTAMHGTCQLKNIKEEDVVIYDRSTYLGFFKPRPKLENSEGRILNIDITGPIAAAKVELETPKRLFTDYFNLLKLNNQWYIVDKISTSIEKQTK